MKLKVEGISDCAEVIVAALMDGREQFVFGRRTMPEMDNREGDGEGKGVARGGGRV